MDKIYYDQNGGIVGIEKTNYIPTDKPTISNDKKGAFPCMFDDTNQRGLTKQEYFAGLAMQGILASNTDGASRGLIDIKGYAEISVMVADTLLTQLEKTKEK